MTSATAQTHTKPSNHNQLVSQATHGILKSTKGRFFEASCNEEIAFDTQVIDLNKDGSPEVFTNYYGTCIGGAAGVQVNLYIKNKVGKWISQFGFPGTYSILDAKNKGYPDIEIGGPGECFPIWRWNGSKYDIYKKCSH
jgi:hypothetical protein